MYDQWCRRSFLLNDFDKPLLTQPMLSLILGLPQFTAQKLSLLKMPAWGLVDPWQLTFPLQLQENLCLQQKLYAMLESPLSLTFHGT